MGVVQVYSGNEIQSYTLSNAKWNLISAIFNHTVTNSKEFAKKCCQAGVCPLVMKRKIAKTE